MLKKYISSALALFTTAAASALLIFAVLPPSAVHSHGKRPDSIRAVAAAPAIAEQPALNIAPSPVLPEGSVFIGTGDHSAGSWTR
jgi:hypothetical protein